MQRAPKSKPKRATCFLDAGYVFAPYVPLVVTDLEYFQQKLFSALKIPAEFVDETAAKKAQLLVLFPED